MGRQLLDHTAPRAQLAERFGCRANEVSRASGPGRSRHAAASYRDATVA